MWTLVIVLLALWALAWVTGFAALGSLVHILLAVAVVVAIVALLRSSRVV